jgi:hypothetical protein
MGAEEPDRQDSCPILQGRKQSIVVTFDVENDLFRLARKGTRHHALDNCLPTRQPTVKIHETTVRRNPPLMSKPAKSEAELIAMARAELKVHAECPDGIMIAVIGSGDSWEFRTEADEATKAKPGYPECVAMIVQIGDHLTRQFDVKS